MRVAVIGNGPSAKGKGAEIDACDFVVRMKAFWLRGAVDAGDKTDAWAWFGMTATREPDYVPAGDIPHHVPQHAQHWFTDCPQELSRFKLDDRLANAESFSQTPIAHISDAMRNNAAMYLGSHPSTGFLAVCMAMSRLPVEELSLYGFDCTTRRRPNFADARGTPTPSDNPALDLAAEKVALGEMLDGQWLGEPSTVKLIWPDRPKRIVV